jgi:hypothetical protein
MSGERKCDVALFSENIKSLEFSMKRQQEDVYSRVKSRGQKFTELDTGEYKKFLQEFWASHAPEIEAFFLERFKTKSGTFDLEVLAIVIIAFQLL